MITAAGLLTLKPTAAEVPPAGAGLAAASTPAELPAVSATGKVAVTSVPLTNVVFNTAPFQSIPDEGTNPVPVISRVVAPAPAVMLVGEMDLMAGTGLFTVNVSDAEIPPPGAGFAAVICDVAPLARSAAGSDACISVAPTNLLVTVVRSKGSPKSPRSWCR